MLLRKTAALASVSGWKQTIYPIVIMGIVLNGLEANP
jgi:hypothetical protein